MVIDPSWYKRAFDKAQGVTITFAPYDLLPMGSNGGAIHLKGNYRLPETDRLTKVYWELSSQTGNANLVMPVPRDWWTTGNWYSDLTREGGPTESLALKIDQFEAEDYDNSADIGFLTFDGSPDAAYSVETYGVSTTIAAMLTAFSGTSSATFSEFDTAVHGTPYVGVYPQLQGIPSDVLNGIAGGLGVPVWYTPSKNISGVMGYVAMNQNLVRLVNDVQTKRKIVRPSYVSNVIVSSYRTAQLTNQVVYAEPSVISVPSGVNQQIRVTMTGTPIWSTVIQPVPVTATPNIPYTGPNSIYCVYDAKGYEASNRWTMTGGKITVGIGAAPDEMLINITAPYDPGAPTAVYTIAEGGHPAFYISTGSGVQFNKIDLNIPTGAVAPSATFIPTASPPHLDNSVVINDAIAYSRAVAMVANYAQPTITMDNVSFSSAVNSPVGGVESAVDPATLMASKFRSHNAMFRFSKMTYDQKTNSFNGSTVECTTCGDFDLDFSAMEADGGALYLKNFQTYLSLQYPDSPLPTFGTSSGQFPVGTFIDDGVSAAPSGLAATDATRANMMLAAPSLEQWSYEPLLSIIVAPIVIGNTANPDYLYNSPPGPITPYDDWTDLYFNGLWM